MHRADFACVWRGERGRESVLVCLLFWHVMSQPKSSERYVRYTDDDCVSGVERVTVTDTSYTAILPCDDKCLWVSDEIGILWATMLLYCWSDYNCCRNCQQVYKQKSVFVICLNKSFIYIVSDCFEFHETRRKPTTSM